MELIIKETKKVPRFIPFVCLWVAIETRYSPSIITAGLWDYCINVEFCVAFYLQTNFPCLEKSNSPTSTNTRHNQSIWKPNSVLYSFHAIFLWFCLHEEDNFGFQHRTKSCNALTDLGFPNPRQFQLIALISPAIVVIFLYRTLYKANPKRNKKIQGYKPSIKPTPSTTRKSRKQTPNKQ